MKITRIFTKDKKNSDTSTSIVSSAYAWSIDLPISHDYRCPFIKHTEMLVLVPFSLVMIARRSNSISTEFMLYAKVKEQTDDVVVVDNEYCVPRQEATSTSVRNLEPEKCKDYNVVIHKHPSNLHNFSSIDEESINSNNDVSILIADSKIVKVKVRKRAQCGAIFMVDAETMTYLPQSVSDETRLAVEVVKEIRDKITYTVYHYYHTQPSYINNEEIYSKYHRSSTRKKGEEEENLEYYPYYGGLYDVE